MELVTTKFKSGGLHEKHVVATWNLGNHLSICFETQGNQEKPVSRWPVAGLSRYWVLASSPTSKVAAPFPRSKAVGASSNTTYLPQMLRLRVNGSVAPPPPYISMTWCVINHRDDIAQEDVSDSSHRSEIRYPTRFDAWCSIKKRTKILIRASQKSHFILWKEQLFLVVQRKKVAVYCENPTKRTDTQFVCEMRHCWYKW